MIARLAYPASIKLVRAARIGQGITLSPDDGGAWPELPDDCGRDALLLARPDENHGQRGGEPMPLIHPEARMRKRASSYSSHLCSLDLPAGSFSIAAREGFAPVGLESPLLSIVRAAADMDSRARRGSLSQNVAILKTVGLIDELCGRYSRNPAGPGSRGLTVFDIEPAISVANVTSYLASLPRMRGKRLAQKATKLAVDELGSPLETLVELLLCAPKRFGGMGLPRPICNQPIGLTGHGAAVSHGRLRPDAWWPEYRLVLETNGRDHDSREAADEDARRVSDYQALGLTVFVLRSRIIRDQRELSRLLLNIARCMARTDGEPRLRVARETLDSHSYLSARQTLIDTI